MEARDLAIGNKALVAAAIIIVLLAMAVGASAQPGQQEPEIFPPPDLQRVVNLVVGCNNVALTYPDGTPVGTVVSSIEPSGAMYAIWRLNASPPSAMGPAFEGFAPAAPQRATWKG